VIIVLADRTIREMIRRGNLQISPIEDAQIQPASVDLRLGELSLSPRLWNHGESVLLRQGVFILASTLEEVMLSRNIIGQVHGKSTLARLGLVVEAAGLVDPGFYGQLTLELYNMGSNPIKLARGMMIAQISFDLLSATPERAYGHPELNSHYQGQQGPTPARE
jgi:dCTP deaminase